MRGKGGDGEDVAFVEVVFGVKTYIIIFKEEVGEVVVDATTSEFDDGFFLCPEASERDLGVGSGGDEGELVGGEDMAGEGLVVTADALDVDADGTGGNDAGKGGTAVGEVEVKPPSYPPKGGRTIRGVGKEQFGFAVGAEGEGGLLGDAVGFAEGLAEEEVGEGAFEAALAMLEAEGLCAAPLGEGGEGMGEGFVGDGGEVVFYVKVVGLLHDGVGGMLGSQSFAAVLAVVGFEVGFLVATGAAAVGAFLLGLVNHGGRDDAGGNGDDGVAKNHDEPGEDATDGGDGGDVAVADGGEGDNRPVDAGHDVGELGAGLPALNDKHESAEDGDKDEDKEEIDEYLTETQSNALKKEVSLVDEGEEFEHAENADESEHTQDEEVTCGGEQGDEGEVEREGRHEVDDAEETEGIVFGTWRAVEAEDVLEGEEEGEDILEDSEYVFEMPDDSRHGLDEGNSKTDDNRHHDDDVECFTRWCIGVEHDVVEARFVFEKCKKLFHGAKIVKS